MSLNETPETVIWPHMHYVYIEKAGPFHETAPLAWTELHKLVPSVAERNQITGYTSLYKISPMVYRAGVSVADVPVNLPEGLDYVLFEGGKYVRFVLTGSYEQLGFASGRVLEIVSEQSIPIADNFFIENYLNDPRITPEDDLITQIMLPTI